MGRAVDEFITYLRRFNRKERFFLVGWALGNREFRLAPAFSRGISSVVSLEIPRDAFVAMDYHLDWIYGSAFLSATDDAEGIHSTWTASSQGARRIWTWSLPSMRESRLI
jgi:hypothetical protein